MTLRTQLLSERRRVAKVDLLFTRAQCGARAWMNNCLFSYLHWNIKSIHKTEQAYGQAYEQKWKNSLINILHQQFPRTHYYEGNWTAELFLGPHYHSPTLPGPLPYEANWGPWCCILPKMLTNAHIRSDQMRTSLLPSYLANGKGNIDFIGLLRLN
jgi:hypothetical protein